MNKRKLHRVLWFALLLLLPILSGCAKSSEPVIITAMEIDDPLPPALSLEDIRTMSSHDFSIRYQAETGQIREIQGCYSPIIIKNAKDALSSLASVREVMEIESLDYALLEEDSSREHLKVYTFQQLYKGIAVYGAIMRVYSSSEGQAVCVEGIYQKGIELDVRPTIQQAEARKLLKRSFGEKIDVGQLTIYVDAQQNAYLSWKYSITSSDLMKCRDVYISAKNGSILAEIPHTIY